MNTTREVFTNESVVQRRWHSVVVVVPSGNESRDILRAIVDKVGKAIGITKRKNRLVVKHTRSDYRGYVFVYEGDGTPEDHKKLKRAEKLAKRLVEAIPPDAIKPWRRPGDFIALPLPHYGYPYQF